MMDRERTIGLALPSERAPGGTGSGRVDHETAEVTGAGWGLGRGARADQRRSRDALPVAGEAWVPEPACRTVPLVPISTARSPRAPCSRAVEARGAGTSCCPGGGK